ncbi:MAG: hypothetical protein P9L93_05880 [Candidatus Gorgyraea atricola]|nr:hypothetical protein [Candidatus Gorgyraea atricola]
MRIPLEGYRRAANKLKQEKSNKTSSFQRENFKAILRDEGLVGFVRDEYCLRLLRRYGDQKSFYLTATSKLIKSTGFAREYFLNTSDKLGLRIVDSKNASTKRMSVRLIDKWLAEKRENEKLILKDSIINKPREWEAVNEYLKKFVYQSLGIARAKDEKVKLELMNLCYQTLYKGNENSHIGRLNEIMDGIGKSKNVTNLRINSILKDEFIAFLNSHIEDMKKQAILTVKRKSEKITFKGKTRFSGRNNVSEKEGPKEDPLVMAILEEKEALLVKQQAPGRKGESLTKGAIVEHPTFGRGIVSKIDSAGQKITVKFDKVGVKKLAIQHANLKVVVDNDDMSIPKNTNGHWSIINKEYPPLLHNNGLMKDQIDLKALPTASLVYMTDIDSQDVYIIEVIDDGRVKLWLNYNLGCAVGKAELISTNFGKGVLNKGERIALPIPLSNLDGDGEVLDFYEISGRWSINEFSYFDVLYPEDSKVISDNIDLRSSL